MVRCAWMRKEVLSSIDVGASVPALFCSWPSSCAGARGEASMFDTGELRQDREGTVHYATDGIGLL